MRIVRALAFVAVVSAAARAQAPKPRIIARYGFEAGALAIDVREGSLIAIAGAQGDSAATVVVKLGDAKLWLDSTRRVFRRPAPKKASTMVLQRSMIAEAADSGGAVSFIRQAAADTTTFKLFFSTRTMGGFPLDLTRREATLFLTAMHRAIDTLDPASAKAKAKPAAKAKAKATP